MASPKNTKAIIVKQETYDRLLALRDDQRITNKKASFDDVITGALDGMVQVAGECYFPHGKAYDIDTACVYYLSRTGCTGCGNETFARNSFEKAMERYDIRPRFKYVNLSVEDDPYLQLFHSVPYIILDTKFGTYGSRHFNNIALMWGHALDAHLNTFSGSSAIMVAEMLNTANLEE